MAITNIPEPGAQNRQRQDEAEKRQAVAEEKTGILDTMAKGAGRIRRGILAVGRREQEEAALPHAHAVERPQDARVGLRLPCEEVFPVVRR